MRTLLINNRSRFFSGCRVGAVLVLLAWSGVANAQRSSILVRIDPRFPSGGNGSAIVALAEGLGVTLSLRLRDQTSSFIAAFDELGTATDSASIRTTALDL